MERRINKIHGTLIEDNRVPELMKKVDEATPAIEIISKNVVFNDTFTEITSYEPITIEEFNKIADGTANLQLVGTVTQEEVPINITLFFKKAVKAIFPGGVGIALFTNIASFNDDTFVDFRLTCYLENNMIELAMNYSPIVKINLNNGEAKPLQMLTQYEQGSVKGFFPSLTANSFGHTYLISNNKWTNNSITLSPDEIGYYKYLIGVSRNYLLEISFKNEVYGNICIIVGAAKNYSTTQSFILYPINNQGATVMLVTIRSSYISDTKSLKLEFFVNKTFGSGTYTDGLEDFKSILSTITPYIL